MPELPTRRDCAHTSDVCDPFQHRQKAGGMARVSALEFTRSDGVHVLDFGLLSSIFRGVLMLRLALLTCLIGASVSSIAVASTPDQPMTEYSSQSPRNAQWLVNGGEFKIRFNDDLLKANDITPSGAKPTPGQDVEDEAFARFALVPSEGLQFNAPEGGFDRFTGGKLAIAGGFKLKLPGGETLSFKKAELRYSEDNPMRLDLVGDDGQSWLYLNHLMYKMVDDYAGFYVRSADLRISTALAVRLGLPHLAEQYVGEVKMLAHVVQRPFSFKKPDAKSVLACPNVHGSGPAPGGGTYQADVLMESYTMSSTRCRRSDTAASCDGSGADDGDVVFTPSSTLRNSNKPDAADIPWYQKFTTNPHPYPYPGNDQHPYLIWNMYRVVDDQLEQVGASGVKHAFLTTNTGCAVGACTGGGHILGNNCGDTYGTSNNDDNTSLGPRSELIPATGQWARCGSIYDPDCNGVQNSPGNDNYSQRLIVKESKLTPPAGVSTQFFSESWYIVQDDINIYNTMAHRTMAPATNGNAWSPGAQGNFVLGPVINTWVDPAANPTRNIELKSAEGHTRVAVKTKALAACPPASGLSGTCYRYDYVVNNFDFARVVLRPAPNNAGANLGMISSQGFREFTVQLGSEVSLWIDPATHFSDVDTDAGNNWVATVAADRITWNGPGKSNDLSWGKLFRFSLVTTAVPNPAFVRPLHLSVNSEQSGIDFTGNLMSPNVGTLFIGNFE